MDSIFKHNSILGLFSSVKLSSEGKRSTGTKNLLKVTG